MRLWAVLAVVLTMLGVSIASSYFTTSAAPLRLKSPIEEDFAQFILVDQLDQQQKADQLQVVVSREQTAKEMFSMYRAYFPRPRRNSFRRRRRGSGVAYVPLKFGCYPLGSSVADSGLAKLTGRCET